MNQLPPLPSEQLATEIGVPVQTVNAWADEFKIPLPQKYQRNALQVLQLVKDLKDKNCGFRTIQRQIQLDYPELKDGSSNTNAYAELVPQSNERETSVDDLNQYFSSLREELLELSELAEKYAQANYSIGQMTMQMSQMEEENQRLRAQLRLLPSPEAWEAMQARESTYKNLLQGMQQRVQALEEHVRELSGHSTGNVQSADQKLRSLPELPAMDLRQLQLPFEQE